MGLGYRPPRQRKKLPQPRLAIIKNFPPFPGHEKPIYQPSAKNTIGHYISRHRATRNFLKPMTMNPPAIRPASLPIGKPQRRLPTGNFASPTHWQPAQPYPVANDGPFPHHHRQRGKNSEMQPRRSKQLQIFGAGKEIENPRPRVRQRQTTMQLKIRHTINNAAKTRSSQIRPRIRKDKRVSPSIALSPDHRPTAARPGRWRFACGKSGPDAAALPPRRCAPHHRFPPQSAR